MPANPSAFPSPGVVMPGYNETFFQQGAYEGMSLRDWFAGQAMIGFLQTLADDEVDPVKEIANIANGSYLLADAMLAARENTNV